MSVKYNLILFLIKLFFNYKLKFYFYKLFIFYLPMTLLDFGPIYSQTGNIAQLDFANKCAESGSTIIAIKSNRGIVIAIEKPKLSCLIKNKENKRLVHLSNKIYTAYTGLLTDGNFISLELKKTIISTAKYFNEITPKNLKNYFTDLVSLFSRTYSFRPVGCKFLSAMSYENNFYLILTECDSKSTFYKAYAIGKGSLRANTELELYDFSEMEIDELADHAVRIMYGCYDPIKDKEFDIELYYMTVGTDYKMVEVKESDLEILVEKYKDLNVD